MARYSGKDEVTVTAPEAARYLGANLRNVQNWLKRGLIAGARLDDAPTGGKYWVIPFVSVRDFVPPKQGRPAKVRANGGAN